MALTFETETKQDFQAPAATFTLLPSSEYLQTISNGNFGCLLINVKNKYDVKVEMF